MNDSRTLHATMPRRWRHLMLPLAALISGPASACGQPAPRASAFATDDSAPPAVMREFRAAWVASVQNIDWPSKKGLTSAQQRAEMVAILDKLVQLHMNAVVFQVRPAADALYQSSIEPWSDFLTGVMGRAPDPFYDPLTFAIDEAHKRGLELHVWINPYRAKDVSTHVVSPNHISRLHPELVREYGGFLWLDPGDPVVRALTTNVALDLVRRYDVDGVHMDDYFYPYPEARHGREIEFPDEVTYDRYRRGGGTLARDDWRRENVDLLVKGLHDSIHAAKPWVRFGVSPFGIWRPGYPASVRGFDQYAKLYADARKWLREGWVDYFTPQLYWAVDKPEQSYPALLEWWAQQNVHGRNLWPGNYTGKVAFTNTQKWAPQEIVEQIRRTRAQPGATGNVHFSMKVFQEDPHGLDALLLHEVYQAPALVPASPWLDRRIPPMPAPVLHSDESSGARVLELRAGIDPLVPRADAQRPWLWVVQTRADTGWATIVLPGMRSTQLVAERGAAVPSDIRVTAIDRVGNASPTARITPSPR